VSARCIAFLLLSTLLRSQSPSPYAGRPNLAGFGAMRPSGYPNDSFDAPLTFDFPEPAAPKPMAATVSLRELEQSIPEKALRAAGEAPRYAHCRAAIAAVQLPALAGAAVLPLDLGPQGAILYSNLSKQI